VKERIEISNLRPLKPLRALRPYFIRYKWRLLAGIVFVSLSNLFAVFPAQSVRIAIDLVVENLKLHKLLEDSNLESLIESRTGFLLLLFAFLVLFLAIVRGIFMYLMRQTIIVMSRWIEYDLKNEIFKRYQDLSFDFYQHNNTGDLMARISEDVSRVRMYVGPAIMYSINLGVTIFLVLWVMFSVNARLTWLVILPLPILSISIFYVNNLINRKSDAIQAQLSELSTFVQEAFSGIRVIKAFGVEKESEAEFEKQGSIYLDKQMDLAKTDAIFFPVMFFLTGLSTLITVFAGGIEVLEGRASLGNIAEFVIYVNMLTWPVTSLGYTSSLIQRASASMARINEFLEQVPHIKNEGKALPNFNTIRLKDVSLTYPGKEFPALQSINLEIKKGEVIAILGNTGSGKSTFARLLLRIIDPNSGAIEIDSSNLKDIHPAAWRLKIGYVPQEVFLFSDTIKNNISFGEPGGDAEQQRIEEAAALAGLTEILHEFPNGLETLVGERGITLSGGQKQRVAIARAFIRNPEILVLDDCLSALDTKTESVILDNLGRIMQGKTSVIISHRPSSVRHAHWIIVLDEGKVVESGTHAQLLEQNGKYAEMVNRQKSEPEEAN